MNPEQWLAQYDEKLKAAAAGAARTDRALREVGGSATSQDGLVTVRVNASGATQDIVLRPGVRELENEHLSRVIMDTTRQAQRDVGKQVVEVLQEFVGEGDALDFVKSNLPQGYAGDAEDQQDGTPARRDTRDDEDYFDDPPELIQ